MFKDSQTPHPVYNFDETPNMITLKEAAKRTHLSYSTLRSLCLANQIVHFRNGVKYFVNYDKLLDFLNTNGVK